MSGTVWLVGRGEYSDWRVAGLFSDRETADRYVDVSKGGGLTGPDEYVLHDSCPDPRERLQADVEIRDGQPGDCNERTVVAIPGVDAEPLTVEQYAIESPGGHWRVRIQASGFDHARVRKVMTERTARAVADFDLLIEQTKARLRERRQVIASRSGEQPPPTRPGESRLGGGTIEEDVQ